MVGEIECKICGAKNTAGSIMCVCGEPLEVAVGTASPKAVALSPAAASAGVIGRACALVEAGKVTDKEFEVPPDDFSFTIGRPDLDEGIIPDIDLTKFAQKVTIGKDVGYTVSRKQAGIHRQMGKLSLIAIGSAKTLVRPKGVTDYKELPNGQETELQVGDRFRFGGSEGYVIFEVV